MSAVTLYTTDYCPYCRSAKALLARRGIPYQEVDVTEDPAGRDWLVARTGRKTVPQIFVADAPIGGFDELAAIDASGELARRLDPEKSAG